MSWGERSCRWFTWGCLIPDKCELGLCSVNCQKYKWNGHTRPDTAYINKRTKEKMDQFLGPVTSNKPVIQSYKWMKFFIKGEKMTKPNSEESFRVEAIEDIKQTCGSNFIAKKGRRGWTWENDPDMFKTPHHIDIYWDGNSVYRCVPNWKVKRIKDD